MLRTIGQLNKWSLRQSIVRKRIFWRLIEHRNLEMASAIHYTTEDERDQAASLGLFTKSWVIPLGVHQPDPSALDDVSLSGDPLHKTTTFLFLSRIHPKKQLEHLIEAFSLLKNRQPSAHWRLQIAGAGDANYIQNLKQQLVRAGISGYCQWLGFLEGDEKWKVLQKADWFVLPSASENFGVAAIEALAAGTPPILSPNVAVAPHIASASAGLLASTEPLDLSKILESALLGPPPEMQMAARDLAASSYSWPAIALQLQQAYSSVLR